jgi:hypothetical protein
MMKTKLIHYIALLIICSLSLNSFAQEVRGLNYNPKVVSEAGKPRMKSTGVSVPLPKDNIFFDDFTFYKSFIYPDYTDNWIDRYATITHSQADSSISFGVITLDCFDAYGRVYGPSNRTNPSDTLTSKIIQLNATDNLYLSFFVQGGGRVDPPDSGDSLFLEIIQPNTNNWIRAWDTHGFDTTSFTQIIIPLADSLVIDSTLQFRFRNLTSLSLDEVGNKQGALSNADHWHLDYIQVRMVSDINQMRQLNDIAINGNLNPVLIDYNLIPYQHTQFTGGYLRDKNTVYFRTLYPDLPETSLLDIGRTHLYIDVENNEIIDFVGGKDGISLPLPPYDFFAQTDPIKAGFNYIKHPRERAKFKLISYLTSSTDTTQYLWNDTITRVEYYRDFYSHDDGQPEFGYGISGPDAYQTATAVKFDMYQPDNVADTLSGLYIYFNQDQNLTNSNMNFEVAVWNVVEGKPGNITYSTGEENLLSPDSSKGFNNPLDYTNGFMRIDFEEDVLVANSFFIGIIQYTTDFINIGYDVSFDSKAKTFAYTYGNWGSIAGIKSIPPGSLMIRPIFDHREWSTGIKQPETQSTIAFKVFPNPAKESISIELESGNLNDYYFRIIDLSGRVLINGMQNNNEIDISILPEGLYLIQVHDEKKHIYQTQKLIKYN